MIMFTVALKNEYMLEYEMKLPSGSGNIALAMCSFVPGL